MSVIVIIGAGQIGSAVFKLLKQRTSEPTKSKKPPVTINDIIHSTYIADDCFSGFDIHLWDIQKKGDVTQTINVDEYAPSTITMLLKEVNASYVINAMPFMHNEKIAQGALDAGCNYIDFTEDDIMASKVRQIYASSELACAPKCGLAPGFINYIGHDLVSRIHKPESLMISVGALPRNVNFSDVGSNYNLSWSVDGLVNEYIRPCEVRINGDELQVEPLTGHEQVIIDGIDYEAAFTSGGVGSLVKELKHVPNVCYKTLRYPGHYAYVKETVDRNSKDFESIRKEFLEKFPFCKNDVIVVYADARGTNDNGQYVREVFAEHYVGANGLSAIQCTTAGGGIAILEMMVKGQLTGMIGHGIPISAFRNTETYQRTYFKRS